MNYSFVIVKLGMAYDEFKNVISKIDIITINPPEFNINIFELLL